MTHFKYIKSKQKNMCLYRTKISNLEGRVKMGTFIAFLLTFQIRQIREPQTHVRVILVAGLRGLMAGLRALMAGLRGWRRAPPHSLTNVQTTVQPLLPEQVV